MNQVIRELPPVPETRETWRLKRQLELVFRCSWKIRDDESRQLVFENKFPFEPFCDIMARLGSAGYEYGAVFFKEMIEDRNTERVVCSHLLTRFARSRYDNDLSCRNYPHEFVFAHFGKFINALVDILPKMFVEWAEDMNTEDRWSDLKQQPTEVIRGSFLAHDVDQARASVFWDMAAHSEKFPLRIFSDPCNPESGMLFSSFQRRVFARIFSSAPIFAAEKFAGYMQNHAVKKLIKVYVSEKDIWTNKVVSATEAERRLVFRSIVEEIADKDRQKAISALLAT